MRARLARHLRVSFSDWGLVLALVPLLLAGLVTMQAFTGPSYYFSRQLAFSAVGLLVFFGASLVDWRFLKQSLGLFVVYLFGLFLLVGVVLVGHTTHGAQSWFSIQGVSFQPSDLMKLILILVLAKYFSRRHVEIAHIRHIIVSGLYTVAPFVLIMLEPDLGSGMILFAIWLGMIIASGVSKKHLALVAAVGVFSCALLWMFAFAPYKKARIMNFLEPLRDTKGTGYNALQAQIAVGSGQIVGKGIGYGTQSRLKFLPEYQTDFIFAAFTEEWGMIGALIIFVLYGFVIAWLLGSAMHGASNFEAFFAIGVALFLISHIVINIGMNMGLLPVTGITLPFLSYGGSHLVVEFLALGMVMGMRRYARPAQRPKDETELVGLIGA